MSHKRLGRPAEPFLRLAGAVNCATAMPENLARQEDKKALAKGRPRHVWVMKGISLPEARLFDIFIRKLGKEVHGCKKQSSGSMNTAFS